MSTSDSDFLWTKRLVGKYTNRQPYVRSYVDNDSKPGTWRTAVPVIYLTYEQ